MPELQFFHCKLEMMKYLLQNTILNITFNVSEILNIANIDN